MFSAKPTAGRVGSDLWPAAAGSDLDMQPDRQSLRLVELSASTNTKSQNPVDRARTKLVPGTCWQKPEPGKSPAWSPRKVGVGRESLWK